jgi:hypothetical protein
MSEALVLTFREAGPFQYAAASDELGVDLATGEGDIPAGLICHAAGTADDGSFVVSEVWESRADQEAFMTSRLGPALQAAGITSAPQVVWAPLIAHYHSDH